MFKYKIIALIFTFFFIWIWAWQLGYLAIPKNIEASDFIRSWANPGVLTFPTIVSIFCFFAANYYLLKKSKSEPIGHDKKSKSSLANSIDECQTQCCIKDEI